MKIKKVDDKPMLLHTKKKAKIHSHKPKKAAIKGSNIYTVDRSPKIKSTNMEAKDKKTRNGASEYMKQKSRRTYRKSTVHQTDAKERGIAKFRSQIRESRQPINKNGSKLHVVSRTGAVGAKAMTDHMEGGQEMQQAAFLAYEVTRPVTGTALRGADLLKKKAIQEAKKKIKKVDAGKKLAKLAKDLITRRVMLWIKTVAPVIAALLAFLLSEINEKITSEFDNKNRFDGSGDGLDLVVIICNLV